MILSFEPQNLKKVNLIVFWTTTLGWLILALFVNPIGDFPLNDDWAYGWSVKQLLDTGQFKLSDWTASNLFIQVLWGALFCKLFGFSFTLLRISTLILGLVGLLITYGIFREMKLGPKVSAFGMVLVALNPLYFVSSYTFMNDIPGAVLALATLFFLFRALNRKSRLDYFLGFTLAIMAILTRQASIAVLFGFGVAAWLKWSRTLFTFVKAFLPFITGYLLNSAYSAWLTYNDLRPALFGFQMEKIKESITGGPLVMIRNYLGNIPDMFFYLGIACLPAIILAAPIFFKGNSIKIRRYALATMIIGVIIGIGLIAVGKQMPLLGNVLHSYGIGPMNIEGFFGNINPKTTMIYDLTWKMVTLLGGVGLTGLVFCMVISIKALIENNFSLSRSNDLANVLFFGVSFFYLSVIGVLKPDFLFDRYIIILIPFFIGIVLSVIPKNYSFNSWGGGLSIILLLAVQAFFSVSATHDYLASHRSRWNLLNELMEKENVLPNQINGGQEFNGWYKGNIIESCNPAYDPKVDVPSWDDFSCLKNKNTEVNEIRYQLSYSLKKGFFIKNSIDYQSWLLLKKKSVFLLEKER